MILVAVDPGLTGALAYYDTQRGALEVHDMPTLAIAKASKLTKRILKSGAKSATPAKQASRTIVNLYEVTALLSVWRDLGAELLVIEQVMGLPGQSAPAAFNFGHGTGVIYGAAASLGYRIEEVRPQAWKGAMRVSSVPDAIRARANELIPTHAHLWARGSLSPGSEIRLGRAEAAMLAIYGARFNRR